ncbi:hypothetical protein [Desulfosporosinus shakirovi]|uniref:hypothetical protein n=1 Tax=Desulfosporosinus shakirovi TaxID=2885154 RepID=UPI001E499AA1|nr:hypothetical protein [Desulfosporosinus sp. SRJS8]MCB8818090.1 hypothetical protein [Desulfosporosinus sp. SRJS8]
MRKKILSCFCALALLLSLAGPTIAYASEKTSSTITPRSAPATFTFALKRGAASSKSDLAPKNDTTAAEVYAQGGYMATGDIIHFRVRTSDGVSATNLYDIESPTESIPALWYINNLGVPGNFYLYANADASNYSQTVNVHGTWYP